MGKVLSFLCVVFLCGLFVILPARLTHAAASDYYVDPAGTDDASHGTATGTFAFKTIQYAINDSRVVAGDAINIAAGTYIEQIAINKDLNLIGADNPVIKSPTSTIGYTLPEASGTFKPVIFVFGGTLAGTAVSGAGRITVNISGITVDGNNNVPSGYNAVGVFWRNALGGVEHSTVQNMGITNSNSWGIRAVGTSDATFHGNTVSGYGKGGFVVNGGIADSAIPKPNAVIDGNTVTGPPLTAGLVPNGIQIGWGATGSVTHNMITNHGSPSTVYGGTGILIQSSPNVLVESNTVTDNGDYGIAVTGYTVFGNYTGGTYSTGTIVRDNVVERNGQGIRVEKRSVDTLIEHNTITQNGKGIQVGSDPVILPVPTSTVIHDNKIYSNTVWGLSVEANVLTANATGNWWGSASLTAVSSTISGNVDFEPYYIDEEMTVLNDVNPAAVYVNADYSDGDAEGHVFGYDAFTAIQDGINAVAVSGTVNIAAGIYIESNILVGKSITIQGIGADRDDVVVAPAAEDGNADNAFANSAQNGFVVKANNVAIKNLTINGRGNSGLTENKNNFRAGIVTLDASQIGGGTWNNLQVDNVSVRYAYRRGISVFPRSVSGTIIENSQVEYIAYNHCIYAAGQSQVINNTIRHCFQGIVQDPDITTPAGLIKANGNSLSEIGNFPGCWGDQGVLESPRYAGQPRAIQFNPTGPARTVEIKNNTINDIGFDGLVGTVGVYTRLADVDSVIDGNDIALISGASWAVDGGQQSVGMLLGWSYANGFSVKNNHVSAAGYGLGIMIFGAGTIDKPMVLESNTITGTSSIRTAQGDGTGVYIANEYLFSGTDRSESYVIMRNGNEISGFARGIDVEKAAASELPLTVIANNNAIFGNTMGINALTAATAVEATGNWWGSAVKAAVQLKISDNVIFIPYYINAERTLLGIAPNTAGEATIDSSTPQIVITDATQPVTITIETGVADPVIDVSAFISDGAGAIPQITIDSAVVNVAIPSSTVTSADPDWDGIIAAPTVATITLPSTDGQTKVLDTAIEIGFSDAALFFNRAVKIIFPDDRDKRVGYSRPGLSFTEITDACEVNDQDRVDAQLVDGIIDCKINVGDDLVVWTKHFTKFATYAQTPTPAGGGGGVLVLRKSGDITGDKLIDEYDFAVLMANWGRLGLNSADLNHDDRVDEYDFAFLMANWGL